MPEGPEIRLAADRIATVLESRTADEVWFAFERLKEFEESLTGRRIDEVATRGKALLIRFEGGLNVYAHSQLYGRWYVVKPGVEPKTGRRLRAAFHTEAGSALLFSASEIDVLFDRELGTYPYIARLGHDVLDASVRPADVRERMRDKRFARRSLGGLLLDQSFLCGVGNYLRSEILFVAGIAPTRRPSDLDDRELGALSRAALDISRRAYRTRGITNDAAIVKRLKKDGLPRRAYRHFVFGRDGDTCHRCGGEVRRSDVAGRRLYACAGCQS